MAVPTGLGINCNYREGGTLGKDIPMLAEHHFTVLRQLIGAYYSRPSIDAWNGWLNEARKRPEYKRIVVGLGNGARRMGTGNWQEFEDAILAQAAYLAGLKDSRIEMQLGNELELNLDNTFDAAAGRARTRALATKVKNIVGNDLTISYASAVYTGQEVKLWNQEGLGALDRISFNIYGPRPSFIARVREIESLFPNNKGWVSEWGASNGRSDFTSDTGFRDEIAYRLRILDESDIQEYCYYSFKENQDKWGAVETGGHVRPIWPVLIGSTGISFV